MGLVEKKIRQQNRDITLILIPVVLVLAKIIHLCILPDKYYYDSWRMLSMLTGENFMMGWGGYQTTVDFYNRINFFNLSTLNQWSIVMGAIMTPVVMIMISRTKEMDLREVIFSLMAVGLMNIYVFSITKEMIQFLFFVLIYIVICLPINNTLIKTLCCAGVFYWESTFYRGYYIIMAVLSVIVYFVFLWLKRRKRITKKNAIVATMFCFLAVFLIFYVSQFIMPTDYEEAINVRDQSVNEGANTAIINPIEVNNNYLIFVLDYMVAAFRMMIPVELLFKSPVYCPFVIYQVFILYYYIKTLINIQKIDSNMIVVLSCFSAYLLGSFVFEPDFGSWVRHEAATFPILQMMAFRSHDYGKKERYL